MRSFTAQVWQRSGNGLAMTMDGLIPRIARIASFTHGGVLFLIANRDCDTR